MADPFEPIKTPEEQNQLLGQWSTFLDNPANRASLLQFGIAAMQPLGFGEGVGAHLGNAVGYAGEAAGRRAEMERKQQETDVRGERERRQLEEAQSRGETRDRNLQLREQGLGLREQSLGMRELFGKGAQRHREDKVFYDYIGKEAAAIEKRATDIGLSDTDPVKKQFAGKSRAEIEDILLADPAVRERFKKRYPNASFSADEPAAPSSSSGSRVRTYNPATGRIE